MKMLEKNLKAAEKAAEKKSEKEIEKESGKEEESPEKIKTPPEKKNKGLETKEIDRLITMIQARSCKFTLYNLFSC